MAGIPVDRQAADNAISGTALAVRLLMTRIERLAAWNDMISVDVLQAPIPADPVAGPPGFGYSPAEATAIKAFMGRLETAGAWLTGGPLPTEVHDVRPDLAAFTGLQLD